MFEKAFEYIFVIPGVALLGGGVYGIFWMWKKISQNGKESQISQIDIQEKNFELITNIVNQTRVSSREEAILVAEKVGEKVADKIVNAIMPPLLAEIRRVHIRLDIVDPKPKTPRKVKEKV